jgi:hypothetical protein
MKLLHASNNLKSHLATSSASSLTSAWALTWIRFRPHCRFKTGRHEPPSGSGAQWIHSSTKRQRDRAHSGYTVAQSDNATEPTVDTQ